MIQAADMKMNEYLGTEKQIQTGVQVRWELVVFDGLGLRIC